jgi:hypothetical protein
MLGAAVLGATGLSACAAARTEPAGAEMAGDRSGRVAGATAVALDTYHATDSAFYHRLSPDGALPARPPADLIQATAAATLVVLARVVDVRPTRMVADIHLLGLVLGELDVIKGTARHGGGDVVIEFPAGHPHDVAATAAELKSHLPQGRAVWFLRWQGEKPHETKPDRPQSTVGDARCYGLVHPHAVFVQGPSSVIGAFNTEPDTDAAGGVVRDARRFARLSDLVKRL